jgi:predicted small lipoprotein YifL
VTTPRLAALFLGLCLAAGTGCGRKGPLELPRGLAPKPVEQLSAAPKEGTVSLTWTNPVKTVSGKPLGPLAAVEIWVFERDIPAAGSAPRPDAVEASARLVRRIETPATSFVYEADPAGPKILAFTVRVFDRAGRASDYSPVAVAEFSPRPDGVPIPARGERI